MMKQLAAVFAAGCLVACGGGGADGNADDADAGVDGGNAEPGEDAGIDAPTDPGPLGRVLYPLDRRHSPITPEVVQRLSTMAAAPRANQVFMKVGDSITFADEFLRCFDGGTVNLADRAALQPTIHHYLGGSIDDATPFMRASFSAYNGATSASLLEGSPSKLARELTASSARVGVTMIGTNDVRRGRSLDDLVTDLWTIVDAQLAAGTIPLLSSIPANSNDAWADVQIPRWNLAIRGLAQGRQVPFMDLHRALSPLPNRGLSSDGVHPSVAPAGACVWTSDALQYGYNMRNLVTIESLARVRAALAGTASDASATMLSGEGTAAAPHVVPYPFADLGDTRTGEALASTHGCGSMRANPGREVVYTIDLPAQVRLHAQVIDRGATDVDLHVIQGGDCKGAGDSSVVVTVGPGPVTIVVDTPAEANEGEFLLVLGPRVNPPA